MNKNNPKAIFIGECMIEISGNMEQITNSSAKININFGGDTFNSAIYFSRISQKKIKTCFVTALGQDTFSKKMISRFKTEKIDCQFIRTDGQNPPGLYSIETDYEGNREFSYWRSNSPAKKLFKGPKGKKLIKDLSYADIIYYSGISVAILNSSQKQNLIKLGKSANITAFDFNYRNALHKKKEAQELLKYINGSVNIHFISYDDVVEIFGISNPYQIFEILNTNKNLILLRFKNSVIYKNNNKEIKSLSLPIIKAIDTTAAGDSFNGAFLALMNEENRLSLEDKILMSHSVTREVIKHKGAIIPRRLMPKF
jgi:2-dehydro-3-deoxygluconokinase